MSRRARYLTKPLTRLIAAPDGALEITVDPHAGISIRAVGDQVTFPPLAFGAIYLACARQYIGQVEAAKRGAS
ncbi:MAG: hypothetical protein IT356_12530 [Gemmatimonadaceae bacterium]|nr:hypothetical protein [Gemmatimonadaceae bacterium]